MHSISCFSRILFDEFIGKEGENVHKVGRTLANRVVERRNMIMSIYGGEFVLSLFRGSFEFELFFLVCCFSYHLLVLRFFLFLDDLLELFFDFCFLAVLYVSWIQNSNFVLLCCQCNGLHRTLVPLFYHFYYIRR
jgi:hypothetical protein